MFQIYKKKEEGANISFIEITDSTSNTYAKLNLNNGGSLEILTIQNVEVIKNLTPLSYKDTFASSILFPFASRIKNGEYSFNNKKYRLPINEEGRQSTLHGLVYNKPFELISQSAAENFAKVTLEYQHEESIIGFPFKFSLRLVYVFTKSEITLKIIVRNHGQQSFPFSLGWHPYFFSSDLSSSKLMINSSKKIVFNTDLIATDEEAFEETREIVIGAKRFDDCFVLNNNEIDFETPGYDLNIQTSSAENYLQVYTINEANMIAIEPLTAPPNSFNNKKGLQVLEPSQEYSISWKVAMTTKTEAKGNLIKNNKILLR